MRLQQDGRRLARRDINETHSIEAAKPQQFISVNLSTCRTSFHGGSFHPALSRSQNTKPTLIRAKRDARRALHFSRATSVISVPASAFDTGQFCFAPCAYSWNFASSIPGISASVSSAIPVIENPSPTFSSLTVAVV